MPMTVDAETVDARARFVLYLHKRKHARVYEFLQALPDGSIGSYLRDLVLADIVKREAASSTPLQMTPAAPRRSRRTAKQPAQESVTDAQDQAVSLPSTEPLQPAHVWRWPGSKRKS
jgi:hypothetical protein